MTTARRVVSHHRSRQFCWNGVTGMSRAFAVMNAPDGKKERQEGSQSHCGIACGAYRHRTRCRKCGRANVGRGGRRYFSLLMGAGGDPAFDPSYPRVKLAQDGFPITPGFAMYRATIGQRSYAFGDLKTLLGKASPLRSGDRLAGVAAESGEERVAAQYALADLPLTTFLRRTRRALRGRRGDPADRRYP